ncbi:hypothetical protein ACFL27_03150 [candidate division CSSED10-310 bacterium]|uniref:Uncharacterized protein n=1 Tax=candidate division CSSED10-310 bacterium TaxID=2855610 RepID=A0ABV6YSK9_UNCC1
MTVINAMRFDNTSGAMSCDEQTTVGGDRKVFGSDKIKSVVPPEFTIKTGIVAAYGGTGTSAIGEEIRFRIYNSLRELAEDHEKFDKRWPTPDHPTLWDVAELAFEETVDLKRARIDEFLFGKYGFTTYDFIQGHYQAELERVEIKQPEVVHRAFNYISNLSAPAAVESIFLNRGILAGYDPHLGYQIYVLSLTEHSLEPVSTIYHSVGSGSDAASVFLASFARMKTIKEKREKIDPVEGMVHLIAATNAASLYNMGVGGYFNIVLIDGNQTDPVQRLIEVSDHRSKLASEIVSASSAGLIQDKDALDFVERLIFKGISFEVINEELWEKCSNPVILDHLLRGYKI